MRQRATPPRLSVVLGIWIAYFLVVGGIDAESEVRGPLTAIPIVASGLLLGLRGGVLLAAIHIPLSIVLGSGRWVPEAAQDGLTGWSIGLALGAGSGWMAETLGRERRQSRALAQREAQLAQAQAVAHIGSWQRNLVTGEASWSDEMWRMLGLEPQRRGPTLDEARAFIHPDDRDGFRRVADPFLSRPGHFEVKHRILRPDGTVRWAITSGTSFAGPGGKPDQWAGLSQDVTERTLAEEALKESEAQRSAILAASPDLVFVFDRERRFLQFFAGQSGAPYVPPEAFLGRTASDVLPPDVAQVIDAAVQRTVATGVVQEIRYSLPMPEGRQEYEARLSPMPEGRVVGLARDVTARVQAEERYRLISEHGSDLVQQFDTKGTCTYASPAARNLLGYEPAELVGNDGLWLLHPDDLAAMRSGRLGEERPDGSHLVEVRARHKNGSWVWMETVSRPIRDGAGTLIGNVAASRNINVRKETESALAASEERFRQMAETSDQVFFVADAVTRRMLYVSPAYRRVTGRDPAPLYDDMLAWIEHVVAEDRPRVQAAMEAFGRTGVFDEEFRFVRGDGAVRWARDRVYPIRDEDGAITRLAGISEDVTVRKEAEEEGRRREALLAQAESIAHMCSWEADMLTYRTHWSAEAFALFGLPRDTPMTYESWLSCVHPDDRDATKATSDRVMATGQPAEFECRIVRRSDGAVRHTFNRTIPTVVGGKVVRLNGVNQDITQEKEAKLAQERLAAKEVESARLREAAEFKAQFLNNAAHELSTPLTPIKIQIASMQRGLFGELGAEQAKAMDLLGRNLDRLAMLVKDLLDASRLQSGRLGMARRPVALHMVVEDALESLGPRAREEGVTLHGSGLSSSAVVTGDEGRLHQVLLNLLHNALKFTPAGGKVEVRLTEEGGEAMLEVQDSGVGLSQGQIDRLFQPFTQVHDTARHNVGGTGLGLYISRGIIDQHGGTLACSSLGPGKGTTFTIHLPLMAFADLPEGLAKRPAGRPGPAGR